MLEARRLAPRSKTRHPKGHAYKTIKYVLRTDGGSANTQSAPLTGWYLALHEVGMPLSERNLTFGQHSGQRCGNGCGS